MANIPIYIPTYISDQTYNPCRVQPRLLFYNGMVSCEPWYLESGSNTTGGTGFEQTAFPYFDNYNVVSGSFPTTDSKSLLFYNEASVYGELPTNTLYSDYWSKYVELIYNPRTRLLNASTIIPLADYFKMELNDIVELRGNYYHLRAINDYNLKNGECNIQLLGPILSDAVPLTPPTTTTTTSTTTSSTTTTTAVVNPCRCYEVIFGASGGEINYNNCEGGTFNYVSMGASVYYQCVQVIGGLAQIFVVSGDVTLSIVGNCLTQACPPSTTTTTAAPTTTTTTTAATTTTTAATTTTTTTAPTTATLSWSFTESIGSSGYMDIYVNASVIESRVNTSSGTYNLQIGDTINVQVACFTCGSPNTYANAYSFSNKPILADAACVNNGEASILTANYTVVSGDIGNTITLDTFARCDSGCI